MASAEMRNILIVDDHPGLLRLLKESLELRGFRVRGVSDGKEALGALQEWSANLLILDVMLPGMNGIELCRHLRLFSTVPIIMLTALGEQEYIVEGLRAGADDYLTKPFHLKELLVRVEALLRRARKREAEQQAVGSVKRGELEIDYANFRVARGGEFRKLTPIEYRLFYHLMVNEGRVVPYGELLTEVWGWGYTENEDNLRVYIRRLRQMIETNSRKPEFIMTVRGLGYIFQNPKTTVME